MKQKTRSGLLQDHIEQAGHDNGATASRACRHGAERVGVLEIRRDADTGACGIGLAPQHRGGLKLAPHLICRAGSTLTINNP